MDDKNDPHVRCVGARQGWRIGSHLAALIVSDDRYLIIMITGSGRCCARTTR